LDLLGGHAAACPLFALQPHDRWLQNLESTLVHEAGNRSKNLPGSKNILLARFSILRVKKCLATPRVAALQHHQTCDEWNHNSDEPKCKFTIYPLASEND
jgi:hypothetical protein